MDYDIISKIIIESRDFMSSNPYTPGAGMLPRFLAGRDELIYEATEKLIALSEGVNSRSIVYYGVRGVGKTVILGHLQEIAKRYKVSNILIEVPESGNFRNYFAAELQKIAKNISLKTKLTKALQHMIGTILSFKGTWAPDTNEISFGFDVSSAKQNAYCIGDFHSDILETFISIGEVCKEQSIGAAIFIDELQYLKSEDLEAVIMAIHRSNQKGYPIMIFGAGLPSILQIAGDTKSYAERLFQYLSVSSLKHEDAIPALTKPAEEYGIKYDDVAISKILNITGKYPYFLQEFGEKVWRFSENNWITDNSVQEALPLYYNSLDQGFFRIRYNRATQAERKFMNAMAECAELPCSINIVSEILNKKTKSTSPIRSNLIHKGLIYSAAHGLIDFTVPQFDLFLKRVNDKD